MKKNFYILFSLLCMASFAHAQITITQSDFPSAGTAWVEFHDNRVNAHTISSSGPSQSWNYAMSFVVDDTTVLSFVSPSATPAGWATNFPQSTLAVYTPADSSALFYFGDATGFYADGIYSNAAGALTNILDYNPNQLLVPTPFTYLDNRLSTALVTLDQPAMPPSPAVRLKLYFITQFIADAWGSLVTPAGTFPSTLRIMQEAYSIDSTFLDLNGTGNYTFFQSSGPSDTTRNFTWYRNGTTPVLMSIEQNPVNGQSLNASYTAVGAVGLTEAETESNIIAYPNPASAFVNFNLENQNVHSILITDITGKLVRTEVVRGINRFTMGTSAFKKGIYFYNCIDHQGRVVDTGKFAVTR